MLEKVRSRKVLNNKMLDSKTVGSQVQELQLIVGDLIEEDMVINDAFQVVAMMKKFLPSWNDFQNYLKYKHNEVKLEDTLIPLKNEEDKKTH